MNRTDKTIMESDHYRLDRDVFGDFLLTRFSDGARLALCGLDADQAVEDFDVIGTDRCGLQSEQAFDRVVLGKYDHFMRRVA